MGGRGLLGLLFVSVGLVNLVYAEDNEVALPNHDRNKRDLSGVTLRVVAVPSDPFVMEKVRDVDSTDPLPTGNDRFEGFCIDLLDEIARESGFQYRLAIEPTGTYGSFDRNTRRWNGMIRSLVNKEADVAIGDLTVTKARERVVDFSYPWHHFGVGLLTYYTEGSIEPQDRWFNFLLPFSVDVWICVIVIALLVALVLFFLARLSPYERKAPPANDWTPFTLCTSCWFALGTLLRQFIVKQPRAASTRFFVLVWWMFVLIVVSMYIASLTNILDAQTNTAQAPLSSIYDLPKQKKIEYGAMFGGSTWAFFKNGKTSLRQRIFQGIHNNDRQERINSNKQGVEMVLEGEGTFAFLMEEPAIQYIVERQCDLVQVGGPANKRNYAFGVQQNSPYLEVFNGILHSLQESGFIDQLYDKWWKEKRGGGTCDSRKISRANRRGARQLDADDFAGPMILLAVGAAIALIVALVECCIRACVLAKQKESGVGGEMSQQLKEALKGPQSTDPCLEHRV